MTLSVARIDIWLTPYWNLFWTHALRGSYKFGPLCPNVRPYLRPFLSQHFSQDWFTSLFVVFFLLIFCIKLRNHKYSKLTEPIFWENSRLPKNEPKRPNLRYFAWSWGTISTQNWQSQIFWENSRLPKRRPKWPKMARFVCSFFLYFAWNWATISTQNWRSWIF